MTAPADREFEVLPRGAIRDIVLNHFRAGLRLLTNPETGVLFTEDEIAQATGPGSRWWREASAIDDYGQGKQRNALYLNDQARVNRASTAWLENYHARMWDPDGRLPATPGSGPVTITGTPGTPITYSTTVPDPTANWGRSPEGFRFQAYSGESAIGDDGTAAAVVIAMDPGLATNLSAGTRITWAYRNEGMGVEATVTSDFTGGTDVETDADWASRMEGNIRYRQGSGNDAQNRAWTRRASNAIEDAFIYPCSFGTNSFLICITQKRVGISPTARLAPAALLAQVTAFMTPPGSPYLPADPFVVVVTPQAQTENLALELEMPVGAEAGWTDAQPWPTWQLSAGYFPQIASVTSNSITISAPNDDTLPGQSALATVTGDDIPSMMAWVPSDCSFHSLGESAIADVEQTATHTFVVHYATARPSWATGGLYISPHSGLLASISGAISGYFDSLGPGDMFESAHDYYDRCQRFPETSYEWPARLAGDIADWVKEALGGACSTASMLFPFTSVTPDVPTDPLDGPSLLVLGNVFVQPM